MSEKLKPPLISDAALVFAAQQLGAVPERLNTEAVTGGFSLNRRAIVRSGGRSLFVKEVDTSVLEGDGTVEREWLTKDYGVMELLRSEGMPMVPEWSALSPDSSCLVMTAYTEDNGWHWDLPRETKLQEKYIDSVINATQQLEQVTFSQEDILRLSLQPYFRDKIGDWTVLGNFIAHPDLLDQLKEKYTGLQQEAASHLQPALQQMKRVLNTPRIIQALIEGTKSLSRQPNEAFGHCDVRSDNLAYNAEEDRLVLVDWNWSSQTPRKFGSTEFLINAAVKGANIDRWRSEINPELLAGLIGFWWAHCLKPGLGESTILREHQAISAAVAYTMWERI